MEFVIIRAASDPLILTFLFNLQVWKRCGGLYKSKEIHNGNIYLSTGSWIAFKKGKNSNISISKINTEKLISLVDSSLSAFFEIYYRNRNKNQCRSINALEQKHRMSMIIVYKTKNTHMNRCSWIECISRLHLVRRLFYIKSSSSTKYLNNYQPITTP